MQRPTLGRYSSQFLNPQGCSGGEFCTTPSSCSLSLTFTASWIYYFVLIFHFLLLASCSRSNGSWEKFSKGVILKQTSLMEVLWTTLRDGVEHPWNPVEAVPREQEGSLLPSWSPPWLGGAPVLQAAPALPLPVSAFHHKFLTCCS